MGREREAYEDALATVEQFNARLAAKKSAWFWPTMPPRSLQNIIG
jgi:hypothetical protein